MVIGCLVSSMMNGMDTPLKIYVIMSTTRRGRYGDKPAAWIMSVLKGKAGIDAELIDLREWALPFFDEPNSPNSNKGVYENPLGRKWADKVAEADAYIIIAAEYNHGYPAVLKNALDWASGREWGNKPVAFVGYGSAMGARSIEQLRQVIVELGMMSVRSAVHIPSDVFRPTSKLEAADALPLFAPLNTFADGMIEQLVSLTKALKPLRGQK